MNTLLLAATQLSLGAAAGWASLEMTVLRAHYAVASKSRTALLARIVGLCFIVASVWLSAKIATSTVWMVALGIFVMRAYRIKHFVRRLQYETSLSN